MTGVASSAADLFLREAERLREHAPDAFRRMLKESADRGDLFYEHTTSSLTTLRQRVLKGRVTPATLYATHTARSGIGLRRLTARQTLYAASAESSPAGLDALLENLNPVTYPFQGSHSGAGGRSTVEHRGPAEPSAGAVVRETADATLSLDPTLSEVTVRLHETTRRALVVTSGGRAVLESRTHLTLRVDVLTDQVRAYAIDGAAGEHADLLYCDPGRVAVEAVARARTLADAHDLPPGQMPVIIAGGWGGVWLHEAAGHLLEADVLAASSLEPPSAMPGRRMAAAGVTLIDSAALSGGRGSYGSDDEATPGQETVLVQGGIVCGVLTDRQHAAKYGLPPTGNGRRQDFRFPPMPRMTNLVLQPGEAAPEDLIMDLDDGLFVAMIGSGHVVPEEDRFTFDVIEGYRIEAGRLTSPVAGVRVSGRASTILERIAGIGKDLVFDHARGVCVKHGQAVPVSTGMPTVLLSSLDVQPVR